MKSCIGAGPSLAPDIPNRMNHRQQQLDRPAAALPPRPTTPIFAPLSTPMHRRIQTLAVLSYLFSIPFFLSLLFIVVFWAVYHPIWQLAVATRTFLALYLVYYVLDFKRPFNGRSGSNKAFVRLLSPWFKRFRDYFPVRIVVSPEAEAALQALRTEPRPLMLGSHPHGIISVGIVTNLVLDPAWLHHRFPHVSLRLLTLNMNMIWPFWRDWLMALGFASVDRVSCEKILSQKGVRPGESRGLAIVVGGAKEALDASPGRMDLTLNSRNGFFRLALKHGALLFPALSFGENDMYDQLEVGLVKTLQRAWHRFFGFSTPFFFGRGVFNYRFGWLPRRVPITTVIGKPIDPGPARMNASSDDIQALRKRYIEALTELYEAHKDDYEVTPCPSGLRIVQ